MKIRTIIIFIALSLVTNCYSQKSEIISKQNTLSDLKTKVLNLNSVEEKLNINTQTAGSKKSPALAFLFSLVIPGAGQFYLDRMDVGKYFLGVDIASWIGYVSLNVYGNSVSDDSKTYSVQHAGTTDINSKSDSYLANIGNYNNIYEYNNAMLATGQYSNLYNVSQEYWNWDNVNNMNIYETQRKNSERIYNSRVIFGSILIANRIISGISAYLIATKQNKKDNKVSFLNIEPELMYKNNYSFDGFRINLSKNF